MELTWTDAVFSRIALVLFLCRNRSSPNVLKIYGEHFWKNMKNTCAKIHLRGWASGPQALPPPPPRGGGQACGAHTALPPPISALEDHFRPRKNKKRRFRRVCDTEAPPHPVLHLEGRSGVRFGLRRGEIVAIVIINLLPSPIP